jgi:hypothetical protein
VRALALAVTPSAIDTGQVNATARTFQFVTENHVHSAAEYRRRGSAVDGLYPAEGHRQESLVPYAADYFFYQKSN